MSHREVYVSALERDVSIDSSDAAILLTATWELVPASLCDTLDEYGYPDDLAKCIVDAIWSIGSKYWIHVVPLLRRFDTARDLLHEDARTPSGFLDSFRTLLGDDGEQMADRVFANRQRTSSRSGILKSSAVEQWLEVLRRHGIEHTVDLVNKYSDSALQRELAAVKGDGEDGIRRDYLFMLAGRKDLLKWDRQLKKFIKQHLGRTPTRDEALGILSAVVEDLRAVYPWLDVRALDHIIWKEESGAGEKNEFAVRSEGRIAARHSRQL